VRHPPRTNGPTRRQRATFGYLHGLFEDPAVLHALFGVGAPTLDSVFDGLADFISKHFDTGVLAALIAPCKTS
jgi:hypothetical protein